MGLVKARRWSGRGSQVTNRAGAGGAPEPLFRVYYRNLRLAIRPQSPTPPTAQARPPVPQPLPPHWAPGTGQPFHRPIRSQVVG